MLKTLLLFALIVAASFDCPKVAITIPTSACTNDTLLFTSTVTGGTLPYHYFWVGGKGTDSQMNSTDANPIAVIAAANTYTVTLVVIDAAGCESFAPTRAFTVKACH